MIKQEANPIEEKQNEKDKKEVEPEIITKHPLQNEWVFWYKPSKPTGYRSNNNWQDDLLKVHNFNTVEDFWALYNHIELPSRLISGCDYNLFKDGIQPMWEDKRNNNGGRLVLSFKKGNHQYQSPKEQFFRVSEDKIWLEICLCLIGEAFGLDNDKICGIVFSARLKLNKISIWTSDYNDKESLDEIVKILRERTNYTSQITYERHREEKNTSKQPLYTFNN